MFQTASSRSCKTINTGLVHRAICPFDPQLQLVLTNRPRRDDTLGVGTQQRRPQVLQSFQSTTTYLLTYLLHGHLTIMKWRISRAVLGCSSIFYWMFISITQLWMDSSTCLLSSIQSAADNDWHMWRWFATASVIQTKHSHITNKSNLHYIG